MTIPLVIQGLTDTSLLRFNRLHKVQHVCQVLFREFLRRALCYPGPFDVGVSAARQRSTARRLTARSRIRVATFKPYLRCRKEIGVLTHRLD